ncbi:DUF3048 domain-containing protein [Demequina litorisediminis]|uniref:Lipoprotein YerB n=1 Tax=Demequina litorisediminis TaxID=1849022 RepID=A0ABQ6IH77_9MICO|nr:DUF3048 domain-containing protein [Demequina litorisediminis]GMA36074.1 hypothetical protein GCM10025876_22780 [Demequina litorisediminis]
MRTSRALSLSALAVVTSLVAAACSSPDVEEAPAVTATASPTPVERTAVPAAPDDGIPDVVWPLTGADATKADEADLARAALSIKIENSADARPQQNVQNADIVFEEYVEAGISRLIAVYQSDVPETLGPVRSMRPMDKNIMGSMGGPLIFSGAQGRFINATRDTGQEMIAQDTGGYGFFRTSDRSAPHNLYGTPADFYEQTDATAPDQQFAYAYEGQTSNVVDEGKKVSAIDISMSQYSHPGWRWDADEASWMRIEGGEPHTQDDGTQVNAENVVMLWVTVKYTSSSGGSSVPETLVAGESGTGYVAAGDSMVEVEWSKAGQFDPFVITTPAGEDVELVPGNTWVELIPNKGISNDTSIDIS